MKKLILALVCFVILAGCSTTPEPDQTYKSVKQLADAFNATEFAIDNGYTCSFDSRKKRRASVDSSGYEQGECLHDGNEQDGTHFGILVSKTTQGEVWMEKYPLLQAVQTSRGVLKGPEYNWEIMGEVDLLDQVQEELGGELYIGTATY